MHKISVIVTTYNRKYEVRRALDSVYTQTVTPYEVLLIDDCSGDGTRQYIESFQFKNLKYFELSENSGPGAARNYGIRQSTGDYIAFLDSDNEWYQTKLEEFEKVIQSLVGKWDVIYSKYKKHDKFDCDIFPKKLDLFSSSLDNMIWLQNLADASSSIYKKDFLEEIGLFSETMTTNIDWELLLRGRKKREILVKSIDKVLTENWIMFDSISENVELERKEMASLFLDHANNFFQAIIQNQKAVEEQYTALQKHYEDTEKHFKDLLERKSSFYDFMSKWMQMKLEGGSVSENLIRNKCEKIAIYGAGKHGKYLYQDLLHSKVQVEYFIDRNKDAVQYLDTAIYTIEERLPMVDAIIVSPFLEFQTIKNELEKRCKYRIIALNEIIEW